MKQALTSTKVSAHTLSDADLAHVGGGYPAGPGPHGPEGPTGAPLRPPLPLPLTPRVPVCTLGPKTLPSEIVQLLRERLNV